MQEVNSDFNKLCKYFVNYSLGSSYVVKSQLWDILGSDRSKCKE